VGAAYEFPERQLDCYRMIIEYPIYDTSPVAVTLPHARA
jgi:hypothetical protein